VTEAQAIREAKRRWGPTGFARSGKTYGLHGQPDPIFVVGSRHRVPGTIIRHVDHYGSGDSYAAAFANAEERERQFAAKGDQS
jgi:sugar/nucleoside kinase (ribokinase family)